MCAGSRKSQINPFVIPHRSFQPVRISTTRFYATSASSPNSSSFLLRLPVVLSREKTTISSLSFFLSSPFLDSHYPIFIFFILSSFTPLVFRCILTNPRARSASPFFCIFFPLIYHPYISRNLSSGQRFNRVCFVCFSCVNLNSNFLAIQAYRHYDIWRRGLRLKEGFVRVSKLRSSQSRTPTGIGRHAKRRTRQRDLLKQREQRDFLSYLSSFFWQNRERSALFHSIRPSFGIFIALLLHHRAYSRSDRIIVRLSYVALLIAIKERQFGKYEKIRNFFLPKRKRFSSSSHHVTFIRLMSSHFLP